MTKSVSLRLSTMMFFQYAIWGAWYVTMGTYLGRIGFQGNDIGSAYSTTGWAAMISPFFVGMIADRFFSSEKVLGIMHIVGGACLYFASQVISPSLFFWVLILYTLCYMPTLALANSISFHQMKDPGKEFPRIRVLGTIGWIAAGWVISLLNVEATALPLVIAAGTSIVFGLYCLTMLPKTPPKAAGQRVTVKDILGLEALKLMKNRSFLVFTLSSLAICIPLSFYYSCTNLFLNESGVANAAGKMTFGQISEILFMVVMPFFFVRLGIKKMLLAGMVFWFARYACFAYGNSGDLMPLLYAAIIVHGICYDFFFVAGQIYVDKKAPVAIRASAQGFFAFITWGLGMLIGSRFSGWIVEKYQIMDGSQNVIGHDWKSIWMVPAWMSIVVAVLFFVLFSDKEKSNTEEGVSENRAAA